MKRSYCVFIFFVVALEVASGQLQAQRPECGPCDRAACEKVTASTCPAGVLLDECGCCNTCARSLQQSCGGEYWSHGRCGRAYFCQGPNPRMPINIGRDETGTCLCRDVKRVCGSDGVVYDSVCALNETSFEEQKRGGHKIEVSHDRNICRSAPRINLVSPNNAAVVPVGEQTYMQCEGEGFPTPVITWSKGGAVLPGDLTNVAVQTVGGPQENQATGWLLISPIGKEDSGTYTCEVRNGVGEQVLRRTVDLTVTTGPDAQ